MCFVNDNTSDGTDINQTILNVILQGLRCAVEHGLLTPVPLANFGGNGAVHTCCHLLWYSCNVVACCHLLVDQWFCRCHKNNFSTRKPSIKIVHDNCCDKCFAETSWKADQCVAEKGVLDNYTLVFSDLVVCWVDPSHHFCCINGNSRCL